MFPFIALTQSAVGGEGAADDLAPPVEDGPFLRPARAERAEPVWGIVGGVAVGLWPTPGPRGLVRIFAPYLGLPRRRVINYVAVEPIVDGGKRGLSELEVSQSDGVQGKAMWSSDGREGGGVPQQPWKHPAAGTVIDEGGVATLVVTFQMEAFENGAHPIVEVTLREDAPHEVGFRVFGTSDSAAMDACVLSATMGNYARARELWLRDRVVTAPELWPGEDLGTGFAPHRAWGIDDLLVQDGEAIVAVTPDEADPAAADQSAVAENWRYVGRRATQYWRAAAADDLTVQVNARGTYWASETPIPGGISFENFELFVPFHPGRSCRFGVTQDEPASLGFRRSPDASAGS